MNAPVPFPGRLSAPLIALCAAVALVGPGRCTLDAQSTVRAPQADAVDAIFSEWSQQGTPGCAVGVVKDGRFVYRAGYGSAHLDWLIPNTASTVFYVGSISKQFTAASIALLSQDGSLKLDADIHEYLPELMDYGVTVTVRNLIHHISGIPDIYRVMSEHGLSTKNVFSRGDALDLLATEPLDFAPGDRYSYSNGGYFLLSLIVERASGQTLREYARDRIFRPLGMLDTHFHDDPAHIVANRAMSYQPDPDGAHGYVQSYEANFALPGAGGLYTTVQDLLLWDRNFYDDRLGSAGLMQLLHAPGQLSTGEPLDYAFALRHGEHRGLPTVGHTGSFMGFKAAYIRFPEQHFSVWTLCNYGPINPQAYSLQIADVFLDDGLSPGEQRP